MKAKAAASFQQFYTHHGCLTILFASTRATLDPWSTPPKNRKGGPSFDRLFFRKNFIHKLDHMATRVWNARLAARALRMVLGWF